MTELRITPDMAGCWLDGSQGWHNTHRIINLAVGWGWTGPSEEGWEGWEQVVERYAEDNHSDDDCEAMTGQGRLADQAFDYLDSLTESCHFERDMGELTLFRCQDLESTGPFDECDCEVKS